MKLDMQINRSYQPLVGKVWMCFILNIDNEGSMKRAFVRFVSPLSSTAKIPSILLLLVHLKHHHNAEYLVIDPSSLSQIMKEKFDHRI